MVYHVKMAFNITVASEIMAILCLSRSIKDLKDKISRITYWLH